jgi:hypothetical protein
MMGYINLASSSTDLKISLCLCPNCCMKIQFLLKNVDRIVYVVPEFMVLCVACNPDTVFL